MDLLDISLKIIHFSRNNLKKKGANGLQICFEFREKWTILLNHRDLGRGGAAPLRQRPDP
jgi:hypothetical protein